jgi:hypothetical protein
LATAFTVAFAFAFTFAFMVLFFCSAIVRPPFPCGSKSWLNESKQKHNHSLGFAIDGLPLARVFRESLIVLKLNIYFRTFRWKRQLMRDALPKICFLGWNNFRIVFQALWLGR